MRVITGTAKGKKIKIPKEAGFRPTSDKTRETLFNILSDSIRGSIFLDCFAGSGAVGLEAASRGAVQIVAVEKDRRNCRLIRQNFADAGLQDRLLLLENDFIKALTGLDEKKYRFDFLFFDPPYFALYYPDILDILAKTKYICHGIVIIEHFKKTILAYENNFNLYKLSTLGDTHLTLLKKKYS